MSTKTFGEKQKSGGDFAKEIYKLLGQTFPIEVVVSNGKIVQADYQTEWKDGSTTPVKNKKGDVVSYKENYKDRKLTAEQIKKIDDYLSKNIES